VGSLSPNIITVVSVLWNISQF